MHIQDRAKDLIKSGGEWISSVDLENALMAHPAVSQAAVIAMPDPKWDERPLAVLVLRPGAQHPSHAELTAFLAPRLPSGGCPTPTRWWTPFRSAQPASSSSVNCATSSAARWPRERRCGEARR